LRYKVLISDTCLDLIGKISDRKIQRRILDRIEKLSDEPEKQGKSLVKDLAGFRSLYVSKRYRIIYRIGEKTVTIYVLAVGIRKEGDKKDIYAIAKKLLNAGLLELDENEK